jgi:hypothetical protein
MIETFYVNISGRVVQSEQKQPCAALKYLALALYLRGKSLTEIDLYQGRAEKRCKKAGL